VSLRSAVKPSYSLKRLIDWRLDAHCTPQEADRSVAYRATLATVVNGVSDIADLRAALHARIARGHALVPSERQAS
jgi:hypothetical protein